MRARGVVASGHQETGRAAAAVLEEGGNAFDAALAAMCTACVSESVLASFGGGGFLLARPAQGRHQDETIQYDFFAQTPQSRNSSSDLDFVPVLADFGPTQQQFHIGMSSIATPGVVRGMFEVHRDLGHMPMRQIVEPAVRLAREGVRIGSKQAYMIGVVGAILKSSEASLKIFGSPDRPGELIGEGDVLTMPEFAETLEILAIEGDGLFYRGEIAKLISDDCGRRGGYLGLADLEGYSVERRHPLHLEVFGSKVHLNPPPSTGGILIGFALELLKSAELETLQSGSRQYLTRLAHVMKMTNQARLESRLHELDAENVTDTLLHSGFVDRYVGEILGRPAAPRGTTHISVVDAVGNVASLSMSNGEGSGYVVPGTGIMLNNMLGEEDINPHGFHEWPPNTRMSSMMAPTLVLDPELGVTALGSGGSNRIRTAILQVLLNSVLFRMPLEDAVMSPRIHVEGEKLSVEQGYSEAEVDALVEQFPDSERWGERNMFFGGVHAVRRTPSGEFEGAGDIRRGGVAIVA